MEAGKILLVGGYGHVGTALAHELAVRYSGRVIIAGRHHDRAKAQGPNGTWQVSLASHQESKTTALCALPMVEALYEGRLAHPGVWLPEQVVDPTVYLHALSDLGLSVQIFSQERGERTSV